MASHRSGGIPMPVSTTSIDMGRHVAGSTSTRTVTVPSGVNLSAFPRSLSEKEPVYQSIVAVSRVEGDNDSSLLWSLLSRRHAEATDERALQENVSTLGAATLSTGSTE